MFSFHKPKIYRSSLGCCICKAKSSSSRFTDSKKYEAEFENCFRIQEKRCGEICNACVLLVKRWKKLTVENRSIKHWHHVVDARAGPGTKLSSNRRVMGPQNSSTSNEDASTLRQKSQNNDTTNKSDVLPLSSSQSGNQSTNQQVSSSSSNSHGTSGKRASSLSKALAIDTNVSTFTFGEPRRKTYGESYNPYSTTQNYSNCSTSNSNGSFSLGFVKPQSALSSSAFESVMKRFRQRQQQEQLRVQRRQANINRSVESSENTTKKLLSSTSTSSSSLSISSSNQSKNNRDQGKLKNTKTHKCSDSKTSMPPNIDSFKVSNILDAGIWKKERTCCGLIFRGPNNEIAIFPKFIKPCQHYTQSQNDNSTCNEKDVDDSNNADPKPRTTKSASISSCDSNTSGVSSDQRSNFEQASSSSDHLSEGQSIQDISNSSNTKSTKTKRGSSKAKIIPTIIETRRQSRKVQLDKLNLNPESPSNSSQSSTESQISRSMILACQDDDDDDDDDEGEDAEIDEEVDDEDDYADMVDDEDIGSELAGHCDGSDLGTSSSMADEETTEDSNTNASSSVESLIGQKAIA